MIYLISKLFFCLAVMLLLGFLLGWWVSMRSHLDRSKARKKASELAESDHKRLANELREEKLNHEVSEQKFNTVQAQCYEMKREIESQKYAAMKYKEILLAERKLSIDQRFKLERNLTQREIRIDDLDLDLQNTRLQAARDLNRLNGRLRLLASEEEQDLSSVAQVRHERDRLQQVLNEQGGELSRIRKQLQNLEETDDQSTQELTQSAQMYSQLQETYASLNGEYERLSDHYLELEDKLDGITQERDSLQTEIIDIGSKKDALGHVLQSAGSEQDKLKAQLTSATQEAEKCRVRHKETFHLLEEQRVHCRSITEHFAGMDQALAQSRIECSQLKAKLDAV